MQAVRIYQQFRRFMADLHQETVIRKDGVNEKYWKHDPITRNDLSRWKETYPDHDHKLGKFERFDWHGYHGSMLGGFQHPRASPYTHSGEDLQGIGNGQRDDSRGKRSLKQFEGHFHEGQLPQDYHVPAELMGHLNSMLKSGQINWDFLGSKEYEHYLKHYGGAPDERRVHEAAALTSGQILSALGGEKHLANSYDGKGLMSSQDYHKTALSMLHALGLMAEKGVNPTQQREQFGIEHRLYRDDHGLSHNIYLPPDFLSMYAEKEAPSGMSLAVRVMDQKGNVLSAPRVTTMHAANAPKEPRLRENNVTRLQFREEK